MSPIAVVSFRECDCVDVERFFYFMMVLNTYPYMEINGGIKDACYYWGVYCLVVSFRSATLMPRKSKKFLRSLVKKSYDHVDRGEDSESAYVFLTSDVEHRNATNVATTFSFDNSSGFRLTVTTRDEGCNRDVSVLAFLVACLPWFVREFPKARTAHTKVVNRLFRRGVDLLSRHYETCAFYCYVIASMENLVGLGIRTTLDWYQLPQILANIPIEFRPRVIDMFLAVGISCVRYTLYNKAKRLPIALPSVWHMAATVDLKSLKYIVRQTGSTFTGRPKLGANALHHLLFFSYRIPSNWVTRCGCDEEITICSKGEPCCIVNLMKRCKYLLDMGVDPDAKDVTGTTSTQLAVRWECVTMLLRLYGGDAYAPLPFGNSQATASPRKCFYLYPSMVVRQWTPELGSFYPSKFHDVLETIACLSCVRTEPTLLALFTYYMIVKLMREVSNAMHISADLLISDIKLYSTIHKDAVLITRE
jgi:hypothetical protein